FRRLRDHSWLVRGSVAAAVLVLAQAVLGGLTVEHGLHAAFVAAHLGLAMLLLALLITLHRIARPAESSPPVDGSRALRATAAVAVRRRAGEPAMRERFLPFLLAPALLALQILLGAMNVWLGKHPALIVAHLTLATLLWATVIYAAASLLAVPAGARQRAE